MIKFILSLLTGAGIFFIFVLISYLVGRITMMFHRVDDYTFGGHLVMFLIGLVILIFLSIFGVLGQAVLYGA